MNRKIRGSAALRADKRQQKIEGAAISDLFPTVSGIAISMLYQKTGVLDPLVRKVNFTPSSLAALKVSCLCADCAESSFDFNGIIKKMIKARSTASKGTIDCDNCSAPECSDVAYSITIKYVKAK